MNNTHRNRDPYQAAAPARGDSWRSVAAPRARVAHHFNAAMVRALLPRACRTPASTAFFCNWRRRGAQLDAPARKTS